MSPKISPKMGLVLIGFGILSRFLPHLPNSTAIGAIALLAGVHYSSQRVLSFVIPLMALFLSDLFFGFHNTMIYVYGSVALSVFLGQWLLKSWNWKKIIGVSFLSSFSFFIITNLGVWYSSGLYPTTMKGLFLCFTMALPFFRDQMFGDLMYVSIVFGCYSFLRRFNFETQQTKLST